MSYRNEGDGEGTGRGPAPSTQQQAQAHPHAGKGSPKGGQFVKKGTGSGNSGRGTRKTTHPTTKPGAKPAPAPVRHGAMRTGDTGADVADLNAVLSKLGLAQTGNSSTYLPSTQAAVMDAQRRLGLKPTGKASAALLRKLHAAAALSPCVKRSADPTGPSVTRIQITPREDPDRGGAWDMPELTRAAMSTMDINDLPDSAFAYIEDGGTHDVQGRTVPRSLRHFPIHDEEHVRAALSRMSQSPYGDKAAKKIHKAAKRMGIGDYDNENDEPMGPEEMEKMRSQTPSGLEIMRYDRLWALDDIEIRRGGDGRTVEAYAAVFNTPTEIKDQHGHYMEVIDRAAFNRAISHGIDRIGVFYHHGMTLHGTPSDLGSVPIGSPVDVRADGKGLRTVSRFNKSALADSVLEAIRAGDIKGYSFRGRIFQSTPNRPALRTRTAGELPTVTRTELGLTEYGPTPTPYYADAGILAIRSVDAVAHELRALDESTRAELIRILAASTPHGDPDAEYNATPTEGPGAEDPPVEALRSASMAQVRRKIAVAKILGGIK